MFVDTCQRALLSWHSQMDVDQKYDELYVHMKELLDKRPVDYDEVKSTAGNIISLHRSFPKDLRFRIWEVLLDVAERVGDFNSYSSLDRTRF